MICHFQEKDRTVIRYIMVIVVYKTFLELKKNCFFFKNNGINQQIIKKSIRKMKFQYYFES